MRTTKFTDEEGAAAIAQKRDEVKLRRTEKNKQKRQAKKQARSRKKEGGGEKCSATAG